MNTPAVTNFKRMSKAFLINRIAEFNDIFFGIEI